MPHFLMLRRRFDAKGLYSGLDIFAMGAPIVGNVQKTGFVNPYKAACNNRYLLDQFSRCSTAWHHYGATADVWQPIEKSFARQISR